MRIAILEDDPSHMELVSHWLKLAGHETYAFEYGAQLVRALQRETFDALLLDWNLPETRGIEVLRDIRQRLGSHLPVIFVTAHNYEPDVVAALNAGADDYLVKPLRRMELLARLEAVTRRERRPQAKSEPLEVGAFRVDRQIRSITRDAQPLELTAKDFELAVLFLRNVGRLLSRRQLLETVWGQDAGRSSRSLDTHVSRVRNKLKLTPEHGWRLVAIYGYGYRLDQLTAPDAGSPEDEPEGT